MATPDFSRREVLVFLQDSAANIEAKSESECWRNAWLSFSRDGALSPHASPFYQFCRFAEYLSYTPKRCEDGLYRLGYFNIQDEFPLPSR